MVDPRLTLRKREATYTALKLVKKRNSKASWLLFAVQVIILIAYVKERDVTNLLELITSLSLIVLISVASRILNALLVFVGMLDDLMRIVGEESHL